MTNPWNCSLLNSLMFRVVIKEVLVAFIYTPNSAIWIIFNARVKL